MTQPTQAHILDEIAGRIAASHANDSLNLNDIRDEFIAEAVQAIGQGLIQLPSREDIVAGMMWTRVEGRAKTRGQRIVRDWLKGQKHLCFEADWHLMVRVSKGRRTTLAQYNADDLDAYGVESAHNRTMVDQSDDELQSQIVAKSAQLLQYADFDGLRKAGLVHFLDEATEDIA